MPKGRICVRALTANMPRLVAALLLCGPFQIAHAQTTTATLFGVVRDDSGAVVPEAKITARNTATSFERTGSSNQTGAYLITHLPVGPYSLLVEKEGFRRFVQDGITLQVDQNARVDAILAVGLVTDSITVSADAIGVDTRAATVGEVVDRERVQKFPLNGRNVMQLANIIPGVTSVSAPTLVTLGRAGPQASVAGATPKMKSALTIPPTCNCTTTPPSTFPRRTRCRNSRC